MLKKTCITFGYYESDTFNGLHCYIDKVKWISEKLGTIWAFTKGLFKTLKGLVSMVSTFIMWDGGSTIKMVFSMISHVITLIDTISTFV